MVFNGSNGVEGTVRARFKHDAPQKNNVFFKLWMKLTLCFMVFESRIAQIRRAIC